MNRQRLLLLASSRSSGCGSNLFSSLSSISLSSFSPAPLTSAIPITRDALLSLVRFHDGTASSSPLLLGKHQRYFSATATTHNVIQLLDREYQEEIQNENDQMTDELKELKERIEKDWKIVDSPDDAIVKLYKTLPNHSKVQVVFHCQDTIENDDAAAAGDDEAGYDGGDVPPPAPAVKFTVTITKQGKTVILTCLSDEDGTIHKIQSIATSTKEDVDIIMKEGGTVDINQYQGPIFHDLAEDVQDAFHMYLEEIVGITTDITSFIMLYTDYKEQNQYIRFLDNTKTILS